MYISVSNTDPSTFIGGKWQRIQDRFLVSVGSTYKTAGGTGGSSTHYHSNPTTGSTALTVNQIPAHNHIVKHLALPVKLSGETKWSTVGGSGGDSDIYWGERNSEYSGGGAGHNHSMGNTGSSSNIPPYFAVFMWYRIS